MIVRMRDGVYSMYLGYKIRVMDFFFLRERRSGDDRCWDIHRWVWTGYAIKVYGVAMGMWWGYMCNSCSGNLSMWILGSTFVRLISLHDDVKHVLYCFFVFHNKLMFSKQAYVQLPVIIGPPNNIQITSRSCPHTIYFYSCWNTWLPNPRYWSLWQPAEVQPPQPRSSVWNQLL